MDMMHSWGISAPVTRELLGTCSHTHSAGCRVHFSLCHILVLFLRSYLLSHYYLLLLTHESKDWCFLLYLVTEVSH